MTEKILEKTTILPEGFSIRPATLDDAKEVTTMFNVVSQAMMGADDCDENELSNDWQSPGFDIEKDARVALNPEGKIVAYQDCFAISKTPVHPTVWGRVHPDYQNMGLGTYLFNWGKERAKHVLEKVPEDIRVSIRTWSLSSWKPAAELLENLGLKVIRNFYMMAIDMEEAPPAPAWPEGITVRTYNHPEDAEAVYRADDDAFKDHFGYVEEDFEEGFKQFQHFRFNDEGFDPNLWYLAVDGDEIAGFSLCRKYNWEDKNAGHVSVLGVRRPWRRKGIALALLHHSFGEYWKLGKKRVMLGVDADSLTGAVDLYEKAGMHVHRKTDLYELELRPGRELSKTEMDE